jgi:potassium-transporting ATPase KdpC subunit
MFKQIFPALRATIVIAFFTGILFPVFITTIAQLIFPHQANGSLIINNIGQVIGSQLIGQQFVQPKYFHPRPSAAGSGYAGESSSGTNLGPTSAKLILGQADNLATKDSDESFVGITQLSKKYAQENFLNANEKAPVDAVTRSGSGLDPDISQANALFQARRVAKARGLALSRVLSLVSNHITTRQFGIFGEPRINVLMLNLALDKIKS